MDIHYFVFIVRNNIFAYNCHKSCKDYEAYLVLLQQGKECTVVVLLGRKTAAQQNFRRNILFFGTLQRIGFAVA